MGKKAGVKRPHGKSRGENYAMQMKRAAGEGMQDAYYNGEWMENDLICIALKRIGVLGPKRILQLHEAVEQVRQEFAALVVEEAGDDPEIWYAKERFDRELKDALGEEYFVPWELRHDTNLWSDGLRSVQIALAHKTVVAEKAALEAAKQALKEKYE